MQTAKANFTLPNNLIVTTIGVTIKFMSDFEWDEHKNSSNIEKHGIGFETASKIFDGPVLTKIDNRFDYGEVRKHSLGIVDGILILAVIHTQRQNKTRIISARRANAEERMLYDEKIRQRIEH